MNSKSGLMAGKRGLIMGVANDRSIAWGIAKAVHDAGAEVAFTYQGEALLKRVKPLAESLGSSLVVPCEVTDDASLDATFEAVLEPDKDELKGKYVSTSRANFQQTMDISCYSFTAVAERARHLMPNGGSMLTLSYFGAERVMPHYNVMGVAKAALECSVRYLAADLGTEQIRVNAISAGPIKTLAASGIGDFRHILRWNELNAPLGRNVSIEEVGDAGLYLLSDLSRGVTGELHHVDSGYNVVGMMRTDAAGELAKMLADFAERKG